VSQEEFLDFRKQAAAQLENHWFNVETQELAFFVPHITKRLGIPLADENFSKAETLFNDRTVTFNHWVLFRRVVQNDKRIMQRFGPIRLDRTTLGRF
jgi:hypothetical protein